MTDEQLPPADRANLVAGIRRHSERLAQAAIVYGLLADKATEGSSDAFLLLAMQAGDLLTVGFALSADTMERALTNQEST